MAQAHHQVDGAIEFMNKQADKCQFHTSGY